MKPLVIGLALCCGLLAAAGCGRPEARYPASLTPCELFSQQDAEQLLGLELDPPSQDKGWLGQYTLNRYCTWEYERDEDPESGPPLPSERSLTIMLVVFDSDNGGTERAAETQRAFEPAARQIDKKLTSIE